MDVGNRFVPAKTLFAEMRKANFKVEKLAKRMGLCPRQFRRNIQKFFGVSAKEYLGAYQVNVAVNRLLAGDAIKSAYTKAGYQTSPLPKHQPSCRPSTLGKETCPLQSDCAH